MKSLKVSQWLLGAALTIALSVGCSTKDESGDEKGLPVQLTTLTAVCATTVADTRINVEVEVDDNNLDYIYTSWSSGDQISIIDEDLYCIGNFTVAYEGSSTFSGDVTLTTGKNYFAVYPPIAVGEKYIDSVSEEAIELTSIDSTEENIAQIKSLMQFYAMPFEADNDSESYGEIIYFNHPYTFFAFSAQLPNHEYIEGFDYQSWSSFAPYKLSILLEDGELLGSVESSDGVTLFDDDTDDATPENTYSNTVYFITKVINDQTITWVLEGASNTTLCYTMDGDVSSTAGIVTNVEVKAIDEVDDVYESNWTLGSSEN